jgi:ribonuclease-3
VPLDPAAVDELQAKLGYRFRDAELLLRALTHSSAKEQDAPSNERLEFLGDAVLGLVVGHFLFWAFPDLDEGRLTRMRSGVVSTGPLARWGRELEVDRVVRLGKGLLRSSLSPSVLANVVEALIGAAFLDGGLEPVRAMVLYGLCEPMEDELAERSTPNWKSKLQEHTQQASQVTPTYELVGASGPDHDKQFVVSALVDGVECGRGAGRSKKLAEQAAAREAYAAMLGRTRREAR